MRAKLFAATVAGLGWIVSAAGAHAEPFGNATAAFNFDGPTTIQPTFSVNLDTGMGLLNLKNDTTTVASGTGALVNATTGTSSGSLAFSTTVGNPVSVGGSPTVFTFTDGTTTYTFTLQSVDTDAMSDDGSVTSISLYLLGDLGTSTLTPTATSVLLNYTGNNSTGAEINDNLALSNPPASDPAGGGGGGGGGPVPEPMSLALLGGALVSTGIVRRFRRR